MAVPLNRLLPQANSPIMIRALTLDSRKVRPGDLFLAIPGLKSDGRQHMADAITRGATAIAYESENCTVELPQCPDILFIPVKDLTAQLSAIAGRFHGDPSRSLHLIGVTGTNGKTSISQLLAQALDLLGERCGIIGTLGNGFHGQLERTLYTTPDALGVQEALGSLKQAEARAVAMEVSSHGLEQGRVSALDFETAVFTNLSRDHLDYHGTMQAYGEAKARLFSMLGLKCRVINLDDAFGRELAAFPHDAQLITYSLESNQASLYCPEAQFDDSGIQARLITAQGESSLRSPLMGRFNLSNLLAVVGALLGMKYPLDEILGVMPQLQPPPGRMQRLGGGSLPLVIIDYAHTPDALEKVLLALRPHAQNGQLHCLFGCGGDRDTGKRPLMARVAEQLADRITVTDDNPRTEDPDNIRAEICAGFLKPEVINCIAGRAEAIAQVIAQSKVGDVVLLAGKGHEDYQEIQGVRHPFSDYEQATQALNAWEASHV